MMWNFKPFADRTAIIGDDGTAVTYRELGQWGDKIAQAAERRCLVFSLCTNQVGSVVGYTAFLNHGVVPVMLSAHLEDGLLEHLLEVYQPRYIWAPDEIWGRFAGMAEAFSCFGYHLLRTDYEREWEMHPDLGLLLTTSGSTGSPKFVRQSYRNILCNAQSIVEYLHLDETERPISTLPMNYTYGLSIINSHLGVGATLLMTDKALMQKEFWAFLREQEATSFGGVPYTYEMLDKLRFFRMKLPSLRYITQAGGKLPVELHLKFAEHAAANGISFVVMYGQCEATARMGYLPAKDALRKVGSMGIAIPGGKLSIIDTQGHEIREPDVTGELIYEGSNVTMGYAEHGEDLALGDERGGRLETGDMARMDQDGYFYIVGRKKRFLKIYGNRVNLDELDRLIKEAFDYIDCASGGVDDHLHIFITDETLANDVKNFVVEKTGFNHAAIQVHTISEIPKNDAGKVLYQKLAELY